MPSYPELRLYIDGAWRTTDAELPVVNPADERVIGALPVAGPGDLDAGQWKVLFPGRAPRELSHLCANLSGDVFGVLACPGESRARRGARGEPRCGGRHGVPERRRRFRPLSVRL